MLSTVQIVAVLIDLSRMYISHEAKRAILHEQTNKEMMFNIQTQLAVKEILKIYSTARSIGFQEGI